LLIEKRKVDLKYGFTLYDIAGMHGVLIYFWEMKKMNKELAEVIKLYTTKSHKDLNNYLLGKSQDNLIAILTDLLTMYINDKNSSTLREFITVTIAGYEHKESKVGYNGYKQSVYGEPVMCEAKPQNVRSDGKRKLNGGGNFTDYTPKRLERDLKENLNILVSGFVDGKLVYILEFPFRCPSFVNKLKEQLEKAFGENQEGRKKGQYLRSANFDFKDYIDCKDLKVVFCLPKSKLKKYKNYIVEDFYKFLMKVAPK